MEGRQYVSDKIGSFADDNHLASKDVSSPENAMLKHENASLKDSKKLRQKVIEIGNEKLDDSMMSHIWEERNKKNYGFFCIAPPRPRPIPNAPSPSNSSLTNGAFKASLMPERAGGKMIGLPLI